jgi:outer membrane protein assembly factor BamB/adenine/guanine phosphoribosyltransferase-like PRPP-binding protein
MNAVETSRRNLKHLIETKAFIRAEHEQIVTRQLNAKSTGWLFDLRRIAMRTDTLDDVGTLFWDTFKDRAPFQVAGLETAAIPLVTALTIKVGRETGKTVSGFFIRKSRKKDGLMRMIEGEVVPSMPVVLVDDLINSGKSIQRQVEVLESLGHHVSAVWTLMRFRDREFYRYLLDKNIEIHSLFTLDDFNESLGTRNMEASAREPLHDPFKVVWKRRTGKPSYFHVVPKSAPAIDDSSVYVGSDDGTMWALRQDTGDVAWSYRIGFHKKGKGIFSSPALFDDLLFFGGYDGNFYALDRSTGKRRWVFLEADWIGSSPAVAAELKMVFVGLEFGLWRKRGGIVALDVSTGKKLWAYLDMPCFTHSSPLYIADTRQVIIGSNDGAAYLFDASTGTLIWKFSAAIPTEAQLDSGFSDHDIKASFAYDARRDIVIFGTTSGALHFVHRKTGVEAGRFQAEFAFYSTPVIFEDTVIAGSVDKNLYCIDLSTYMEKWRWNSGARIFASPCVVDGSVFIGSNSGRLTELNARTGDEMSYITLTERITNKIAFNERSQLYFVPTFANEIYCLEKNASPPSHT